MFPPCFPKNFETEILPVTEINSTELPVYRIIKSGEINRDAFLSTWEERKEQAELDESDPGTYATSCNSDLEVLERLLKRMMRYHPNPIIAKVVTKVTCGPSQRTQERTLKKTSHVDWWIYDQSTPELHFTEVEEDEL